MRHFVLALAFVLGIAGTAHAKPLYGSVGEVLETRAAASAAVRERAGKFLETAEAARGRGNWSGAAKGYLESALDWPGTDALSGLAVALTRMTRSADGCENGYRIKLSDLSTALSYMVLLTQLSQSNGEAFDGAELRGAVSEVQDDTFGKIAACEAE